MALSRIWSAFIIIAITAACIKCFFIPGNKTVFANMVTGKTGDTIKIKTIDSSKAGTAIIKYLDSNKVYTSSDVMTIKYGNGKLLEYKFQSADGIVKTCKTQVT